MSVQAHFRFIGRCRLRIVVLALLSLTPTACASMSPERAEGPRVAASEPGMAELRLARAARAARDYASAVNLYRTVLEIHPGDAEILVELGDTLLDVGAAEDAMEVFNRVDAAAPARLGAELGLGKARLVLHQLDAALGSFDRAAGLAPADPRVLTGQGVALDLLDRHAEAQAKYRAVLDADPRRVAARNNLALSLALSGQFPEAIEIMTRLARSSAATPRIRQNLALIYGLQGDMQQAAAASRSDLSSADIEANLRLFEMLKTAN